MAEDGKVAVRNVRKDALKKVDKVRGCWGLCAGAGRRGGPGIEGSWTSGSGTRSCPPHRPAIPRCLPDWAVGCGPRFVPGLSRPLVAPPCLFMSLLTPACPSSSLPAPPNRCLPLLIPACLPPSASSPAQVELPKDDKKALEDDIQKLTDTYVKKVEDAAKAKTEEVMKL